MRQRLSALVNVRREEVVPVLLAMLFFFCILTALMVLRPARDALGMQRGIEAVRWLFVGTAVVTLLAQPVYGWLVSRLPRMQFMVVAYGFFAVSLVGFFLLLVLAEDAVGIVSGQVFYVWFSAFNLFSTMLFWAVMADRFSLEQGKRFFALIAVGGTLGAIFGPWLASRVAVGSGTPFLLLISAGFLMFALLSAAGVARSQTSTGGSRGISPPPDTNTAIIGGKAWQGVVAVFRSPYLLGIAGYVVIMTVMATLLYFTRLQMVAALGDDLDMRTAMFARIDFYTQITTLILQAFVAGRVMQRFGVHLTLMLLPLTAALGFVGLAMVASITVLIFFEAAFRAVQRSFTRPARETLYTVISREDKYKAKGFIDTFGYRGGDVLGAQLEGMLGRLALGLAGLASVAVPIAIVWAGLGWWLGGTQRAVHRRGHEKAG